MLSELHDPLRCGRLHSHARRRVLQPCHPDRPGPPSRFRIGHTRTGTTDAHRLGGRRTRRSARAGVRRNTLDAYEGTPYSWVHIDASADDHAQMAASAEHWIGARSDWARIVSITISLVRTLATDRNRAGSRARLSARQAAKVLASAVAVRRPWKPFDGVRWRAAPRYGGPAVD